MGKTVEEVATQILTRAYEKIEPIIMDLADKYRLEKTRSVWSELAEEQQLALSDSVLIKWDCAIQSRTMQVISSIGVALAMVRDVVERVVRTRHRKISAPSKPRQLIRL